MDAMIPAPCRHFDPFRPGDVPMPVRHCIPALAAALLIAACAAPPTEPATRELFLPSFQADADDEEGGMEGAQAAGDTTGRGPSMIGSGN
jgi:hypothetical protein